MVDNLVVRDGVDSSTSGCSDHRSLERGTPPTRSNGPKKGNRGGLCWPALVMLNGWLMSLLGHLHRVPCTTHKLSGLGLVAESCEVICLCRLRYCQAAGCEDRFGMPLAQPTYLLERVDEPPMSFSSSTVA